jgi:hypothetical protein
MMAIVIISAMLLPLVVKTIRQITLLYSYQTGEYQSGEQTRTFLNESDARAFFASIKNQQLTVRFDPAAPSVSELAFD